MTELLYLLPLGICALGVWLICIMMPVGEGCKSKDSRRVGMNMLVRLVLLVDMRKELRSKSNPTAEVAGWFRLSIGRPVALLQTVRPSGFIHAKNKNGLRR